MATQKSSSSEADIDEVSGRKQDRLPDMRPDSLRKAMTEPVKVMAPIAAPKDISTRLEVWMAPGAPMPKASGA